MQHPTPISRGPQRVLEVLPLLDDLLDLLLGKNLLLHQVVERGDHALDELFHGLSHLGRRFLSLADSSFRFRAETMDLQQRLLESAHIPTET